MCVWGGGGSLINQLLLYFVVGGGGEGGLLPELGGVQTCDLQILISQVLTLSATDQSLGADTRDVWLKRTVRTSSQIDRVSA